MVYTKSKKITFIIDSLGQGGAENVCVTLSNGLCERGWTVQLCVLTSKNKDLLNQLNSNIKIDFLDIKNLRTGWWEVLKYIRRNKPDKIMCFFYQTSILLLLFKAMFLIKTKPIVRNVSTLSRKHAMHKDFYHRHFLRVLTKLIYPMANIIIAQSGGMKNDLVNHYNVPSSKIKIIHNPVKASIEKKIIVDDKPSPVDILCVGRLEKVKGYEDAIKALSMLKDANKIFTLRFVGDGSEKNNLMTFAKDLNVIDQIDFFGSTQNVRPHYERAKVTLLTSRYEGFPNILVESLFCKTPIVAYDCMSGPREIVKDENGILVPQDDINLLKDALLKSLETKWNKNDILKTAVPYQSNQIINKYEDILISN